MQEYQIRPEGGFSVLGESERSQAATMFLTPGEATGGPDNTHPDSDQWVYVLSGEGWAVIEGTRVELNAGMLVLIEAGEAHEICSDGGELPLQILSIYAPPAY